MEKMAGNNYEWNSAEMIENAKNWSLAGDVALLNSLKKFSENLLSQTVIISKNVDNLLNNLESVSLKLDITKNEFQSLRNTQFIENRVYEDDETLDNNDSKVENIELTDEQKENVLKESIAKGLKIMEKYYDKVEVAVSDSEEENEKSYILQPKDLYADRPLPYLVGTQEWFKKWHVGLLQSDSESESEKEVEMYSSTESEDELPKDRVLGSETSSELDFVSKNTGPVANSTLSDTLDQRRDVFQSSGENSEQDTSLPIKAPVSNEKFAEQLAEKLGNVISGIIPNTGDINRNPIKKSNQNQKYGNLFSDEPPALDNLEDTVLPKSANGGLFSGGKDLFTENDDIFWESQNKVGQTMQVSAIETNEDNFSQNNNRFGNVKSKKPKGLFDSSDSSSSEEDMLIAAEKRKASVRPYLPSFKTTPPIFDDKPPELNPKSKNVRSKKKPVGGLSIFGENSNVVGEISETLASSQKTEKNESKASKIEKIEKPVRKSLKKTSLFDDSSDEEILIPKKADLGAVQEENTTKKEENIKSEKKFNLFQDSDENNDIQGDEENIVKKDEKEKKLGLFEESADTFIPQTKDLHTGNKIIQDKGIGTKKTVKKISLFDDEDDDDFIKEEEDIFANITKKKSLFSDLSEKKSTKVIKSLFEDLEEGSSSSNLFENETTVKNEDTIKTLFEDDMNNKNEVNMFDSSEKFPENVQVKNKEDIDGNPAKKSFSGLFEDSVETTNDDIFGSSKNLIEHVQDKGTEDFAEKKIAKGDVDISEDSKNTTNKNISSFSKHFGAEGIENVIDATKEDLLDTNKSKKGVVDLFTESVEITNEDNIGSLKEAEEHDENDIKDVQIKKNHSINDKSNELNSISSGEESSLGLMNKKLVEDKDSEENDVNFDRIKQDSGIFEEIQKQLNKTEHTRAVEILTEEKTKLNQSRNEEIMSVYHRTAMDPGNAEQISENKNNETSIEGSKLDGKVPVTSPKEIASLTNQCDPSSNFTLPPPISLFDPTPPPDLGWDARSDNSAESDADIFSINDALLDRQNVSQSQQRSSIFDNEPPSLNVNESSGIVRDMDVTRAEIDDSFFNPYASSSRRLSSDIFSDQQNQDSFFVTKNSTESATNMRRISENSENAASKIENLTPSGNLDDFSDSSVCEYSENESKVFANMEKSKSFLETKKNEVSKNVSLFNENNAGNILSTNLSQKYVKNVALLDEETIKARDDKRIEETERSPNKFSPGKLKHNLNINVEALLPSAPRPKSRVLAKSTSLDETDSMTTPLSVEGVSNQTSPILIGVDKSMEYLETNKSTATSNIENLSDRAEVLHSVTKGRAKIPVKRRPSTRRARQEAVRKSLTDFSLYHTEESASVDEVPVSENLAKLNVKDGDFKKKTEKLQGVSLVFGTKFSGKNEESSTVPVNQASKSTFEKVSSSASYLLKNDEKISDKSVNELSFKENADVFKSMGKTEEIPKSLQQNVHEINEKPKSMFEESLEKSYDVFKDVDKITEKASLTKEKKNEEKSKKLNIFGDDSSDEDLFSNVSASLRKGNIPVVNIATKNEEKLLKKEQKPKIFSDKSESGSDGELFGTKLKISSKITKKPSLFEENDGSDSDIDLFGSKNKGNPSDKGLNSIEKPIQNKSIKTAKNVKKLENKEVTDFDPLSAFQ